MSLCLDIEGGCILYPMSMSNYDNHVHIKQVLELKGKLCWIRPSVSREINTLT